MMTNHRKLENSAFVIAIFGAVLLLPPLITVFNVKLLIFGIPLIIIYLFTVWIMLIIATFFLSKHLKNDKLSLIKENDNIEDE